MELADIKAAMGHDYGYGTRSDGTNKGMGYFGELKRPDGGFSTELSAGIDFGKGEQQIPLIVPSLTNDEIAMLLSLAEGQQAPRPILDKAVNHARQRQQQGMSPFADINDIKQQNSTMRISHGNPFKHPSQEDMAIARQADMSLANYQKVTGDTERQGLEDAYSPFDAIAGGVAGTMTAPVATVARFLAETAIDPVYEAAINGMQSSDYLPAMYLGKRGAKRLGMDIAGDGLHGQFSGLWDRQPRLEIDDSVAKFDFSPLEMSHRDLAAARLNKINAEMDDIRKTGDKANIGRYKNLRGEADEAAKLRAYGYAHDGSNASKLGDIITHDKLITAHPEINSIRVAPDSGGITNNALGGYSGEHNLMTLNTSRGDEITNTAGHELQHAIQHREGFAGGGSPEQFQGEYLRALDNKQSALDYSNDLNKRYMSFKRGENKGPDAFMTPEQWDSHLEYADEWVAEARANEEQMNPFKRYQRLSGEAEARDTANRMNLTPEERMRTQPLSGYSVRDGKFGPMFEENPIELDDLISRFDGGESMSLPMDEKQMYYRNSINHKSPDNGIGYTMWADNPDAIEGLYGENRWELDGTQLKHIDDYTDEIARQFAKDKEDYIIPAGIEDLTVEDIIEGINPEYITDSAGLWDNNDFTNWIGENFIADKNIDGLKTSDGAILFNDSMAKKIGDGGESMSVKERGNKYGLQGDSGDIAAREFQSGRISNLRDAYNITPQEAIKIRDLGGSDGLRWLGGEHTGETGHYFDPKNRYRRVKNYNTGEMEPMYSDELSDLLSRILGEDGRYGQLGEVSTGGGDP